MLFFGARVKTWSPVIPVPSNRDSLDPNSTIFLLKNMSPFFKSPQKPRSWLSPSPLTKKTAFAVF